MRLRAMHYLPVLAVILLAAPVWAHTESVQLQLIHSATIAGTHLSPGHDDFKVKDSAKEVNVVENGNVIAQVPCKWIQLTRKNPYSDVQFNKNQITELDFSGKNEAVKFR